MKSSEKWNSEVLAELEEIEKLGLEDGEIEVAGVTYNGGLFSAFCC